MKKVLFSLLIITFILTGCKKNIDNSYIIVDVRTKEEYDSGHITGAINIPYDEIDKEELDKSKTIMVYCKSGARSNKAYMTLKSLDYDVIDLGSYESAEKKLNNKE